jgi:hypothetical protein
MDISQLYEEYVRPLPLADRLRLAERIVAQAASEATAAPPSPPAEPLGQRLRAIRARIEATGEPLLDEDALGRELAERRGGAEGWERAAHAHLR